MEKMEAQALHFLVAEDHAFQRRSLVRMLEELGATDVLEAEDGKTALAALADPGAAIDIIISDLDMPGMDGMELIRHLGDTGSPVAMILSSAIDRAVLSSVATMTKAYGLTLLGAIEKPVTVRKLEAIIASYRPPRPKSDRPRAPAPSFSLEEIQEALRNKEFEPFFQPKIDLATGTVEGAEALARWRHPEKGIVGPYAFIGVMEDGGLIDELTWVMLEKSAQQRRVWAECGLELSISVNLSLKSLIDTDIADRITQIVQGRGTDPRHIVLEVTETAAMTQVGRALENLARLRMRGFRLSIDDYGTGYSSMQQLTRIAFTELKVDQSFVMSAADTEASRIIVETSLDMARKLNMTSVAEGVETQARWDLLCMLGCDLVQGYFIARPIAAADFIPWCKSWKPPA
jgi:EAL domain-containing protein (putative c-di-GMP-specific phosphodiesterase class I)/FixJ family two-component response regulator